MGRPAASAKFLRQPGGVQERLLQRGPLRDQLVQPRTCGECCVADLLGGQLRDDQVVALDLHPAAQRLQRRDEQARRRGCCTRTVPRWLASMKSSTGPLASMTPLADHDQLIGQDGHLLQQVARHEDGATLARQMLQQMPQPGDAGRVETVARFVEDQHVRIAEQRRRQAQALTHAEAEGARLVAGDAGQPHHVEHRVDAMVGDAVGGRDHAQVVARRAGGVERLGLQQGADTTHRVVEARRT